MKVLIISGGNTFPSELVVGFVRELEPPAEVDVITWGPPTAALRRVCEQVVVLGPLDSPPPPPPEPEVPYARTEPLSGLGPARIKAAVAWRRRRLRRFVRRKVGRVRSLLGRDRARTWRRVRRNAAAMTLVRGAELVVAMDSQAIRAAWMTSRRQPGIAAVFGLASAKVAARRMAVARSAFDAEQVAGSG